MFGNVAFCHVGFQVLGVSDGRRVDASIEADDSIQAVSLTSLWVVVKSEGRIERLTRNLKWAINLDDISKLIVQPITLERDRHTDTTNSAGRMLQ